MTSLLTVLTICLIASVLLQALATAALAAQVYLWRTDKDTILPPLPLLFKRDKPSFQYLGR